MGKNFYVVPNRLHVDGAVHLGKLSGGWKFLFHEVSDPWNEPTIEWHTFEQVRDWLKEYVVERRDFIILDEYDEVCSFDEFINMVENQQNENNPEDFKYNKNIGGYRFLEGEFW